MSTYPFGARTEMHWLGATLFMFLVGCQPDVPPSIFHLPLPRIPAEPKPAELPQGAKAVFPQFDGEGFFVSIPATSTTVPPSEAEQPIAFSVKAVHDGPVLQVLKGIGFNNPEGRLKIQGEESVRRIRPDIKGLVEITCREILTHKLAASNVTSGTLAEARHTCDIISRGGELEEQVSTFLQDQYGMNYRQYAANVGRSKDQYFYPQVAEGVLIEHTGVLAVRWEGGGIRSVSGRVINNHTITNQKELSPEAAAEKAPKALEGVSGVSSVEKVHPERVKLLLLPYGTAKEKDKTKIALRYAYRIPIAASYQKMKGSFYLWLDAGTKLNEPGKILELQPLFQRDGVTAQGRTFRRAPDVATTEVVSFQIDPPTRDSSNGWLYPLQLNGLLSIKVDNKPIPRTVSSVPPTLVDFDQKPFTDGIDESTKAMKPQDVACEIGPNKDFQKVDLFATLSRYLKKAKDTGLFNALPSITVSINDLTAGCDAYANADKYFLAFGVCKGYSDSACPDTAGLNLNTIHDHTWVAHELGHILTYHLYSTDSRCGSRTPKDSCPVPVGQGFFHDFADSWAHALEDTNCFSGWFAKNNGRLPDASKNCLTHFEEGESPRKAEVTVPFDPTKPGDHFPEHREYGRGDYADMQIAAAALWAVRQGMLSKDPLGGANFYFTRFVQALGWTGWFGLGPTSGWFGLTPPSGWFEWIPVGSRAGTDRTIYLGLFELETQLANQWASSISPNSGADTINKVTAGFAKAGVFLIPPSCIDETADPNSCPGGKSGADAVIDIDNQDASNDVEVDGVPHPVRDYFKRGGPAPIFHVWTGPRYVFQGEDAKLHDTARCNTQYKVEVANDPDFKVNNSNKNGPFLPVSPSKSDPLKQCYAQYKMKDEDWKLLANAKDENDGYYNRIYYRVTTRDAQDKNERISTKPGNGLFEVPPPSATVTDSGKS